MMRRLREVNWERQFWAFLIGIMGFCVIAIVALLIAILATLPWYATPATGLTLFVIWGLGTLITKRWPEFLP